MELPVNKIICGKSEEVMKDWPYNSVDAIVTDIPYGIGFMGKDWDTFSVEHIARITGKHKPIDHKLQTGRSASKHAGKYDLTRNAEYQEWCRVWSSEALRIAKPGAFLLCFGGTRTYHRATCGLEDAGWQIRDCMMWLYGSGFPKSCSISQQFDKIACREQLEKELGRKPTKDELKKAWEGFREVVGKETSKYRRDNDNNNVYSAHCGQTGLITAPATDLAKLWEGYGTALKPAWEPIIIAMKPLDGTFAANAEKHGVVGLNIDGARIGTEDDTSRKRNIAIQGGNFKAGRYETDGVLAGGHPQGRWPANLILDEEAAAMLDDQSGELASNSGNLKYSNRHNYGIYGKYNACITQGITDSGGDSRFFKIIKPEIEKSAPSRFRYQAKASRAERNAGLEGMEKKGTPQEYGLKDSGGIRAEHKNKPRQNHHPTVKPLKLMQYLCRLLKPPEGGVLLDPFCGSGTTLMAAAGGGWAYIGIDKEAEYVEIAEKRVAWMKEQLADHGTLFDGEKDE